MTSEVPVVTKMRLNNVLGRQSGTDAVRMAELRSLMEAYLRLGIAFTVSVDQFGDATVAKGETVNGGTP